jgi:hypothetical protein
VFRVRVYGLGRHAGGVDNDKGSPQGGASSARFRIQGVGFRV